MGWGGGGYAGGHQRLHLCRELPSGHGRFVNGRITLYNLNPVQPIDLAVAVDLGDDKVTGIS